MKIGGLHFVSSTCGQSMSLYGPLLLLTKWFSVPTCLFRPKPCLKTPSNAMNWSQDTHQDLEMRRPKKKGAAMGTKKVKNTYLVIKQKNLPSNNFFLLWHFGVILTLDRSFDYFDPNSIWQIQKIKHSIENPFFWSFKNKNFLLRKC